jgi:hypothetical protein
MPFMRPTLRTVAILIGALLLRGFSSAYALPMAQGAMGATHGVQQPAAHEHRHGADPAAGDEECCDEQHDAKSSAQHHYHAGHAGHDPAHDAQGDHGTSICKIACDLGAAPALMPSTVALPSLPPVAHVATALQLSVGRILPPEDPPPRR